MMIKLLKPLLPLFLFAMTACSLMAQRAVPTLKSRCTDQSDILTFLDIEKLENALVAFEDTTGGKMAILKIISLQGERVDKYTLKVARKNNIGYGDNDQGLLLLISMKDKCIRLEVSDAWKKKITDKKIFNIIHGMVPYFRMGKFRDGLLYAIYQCQKEITGSAPNPPILRGYYYENYIIPFAVVTVFMVVIFFMFSQGEKNHYHGGGMTLSSKTKSSSQKTGYQAGGSGYYGGNCRDGYTLKDGFSGGKDFTGGGASDSW